MATVNLGLKLQEGHLKWLRIYMFQRQRVVDSGIQCQMFCSYKSIMFLQQEPER